MKMHLNPMVIVTFQRISGASAYLEFVDSGIPKLEADENDYLDQIARQQGWDAGEYFTEKQELDSKFRHWVPTFAAYSVIILQHGVVETRLFALADHLGRKREVKLRVKDVTGKGIEQSALYLERVLNVPVKTDSAWCHLVNLQDLRNLIVHRGGVPGASETAHRTADRLARAYQGLIEVRKGVLEESLWVSMNACRQFQSTIEEFFERLFKITGLPNRHAQLDP
jgi:hypothetical protein